MPHYTVSTSKPLSKSVKDKVAMMITDVHCGHTGAPRTFVQILFAENIPLRDDIDLHIIANVRAGRTEETNRGKREDMIRQMSGLTGIAESKIGWILTAVPAKWIMEGGAVLPDPGEEAEWLEKHAHAG